MRYSTMLSMLYFIVFVGYASAADQVLFFDATHSNADTVVTFDIEITPNADTIGKIQIVDDEYVASVAACIFTLDNGYIAGVMSQGLQSVPLRYDFTMVFDRNTQTLSNSNGATGCPFTVDSENRIIFYVQALEGGAAAASDRHYVVDVADIDRENVRVNGVLVSALTPPGPTVTGLSQKAPSLDFQIVDGDSLTQVSAVDLGSPIRLLLRLTDSSYIPGLDIAAAKLYNCKADYTSGMDGDTVTIIGTNGCWVTNDLFVNMRAAEGMKKDTGDSFNADGALRFLSYTDKIEMSAFGPLNQAISDTVFFECDVDYCFEGSTGSCDDTCTEVNRKKRSTDQGKTKIKTSVTINWNTTKSCEKCTQSTPFVASAATIGTLVAVTAGLMSFMFVKAKQTFRVTYMTGRGCRMDHFHVPASTASLKSGPSTVRSGSSSAGSVRKF